MNWKKGDIAICIRPKSIHPTSGNIRGFDLKMNAEYIVQGILVCNCGDVSLDIGIPCQNIIFTQCDCGLSDHTHGAWWFCASRFIKKDPRSIEERISEAVDKEEYELAHELTQLQRSI